MSAEGTLAASSDAADGAEAAGKKSFLASKPGQGGDLSMERRKEGRKEGRNGGRKGKRNGGR